MRLDKLVELSSAATGGGPFAIAATLALSEMWPDAMISDVVPDFGLQVTGRDRLLDGRCEGAEVSAGDGCVSNLVKRVGDPVVELSKAVWWNWIDGGGASAPKLVGGPSIFVGSIVGAVGEPASNAGALVEFITSGGVEHDEGEIPECVGSVLVGDG